MIAEASKKARLGRLMLVLLAVAASTGCVRRRLTVRTNPPGATVYVDNQRIGFTPCSVDFTHYGTREIRMVKPGFETLTVNQPIPAPNYDRPGIDFFTENLLPTKIRDNRVVSFNMAPQRVTPAAELISRGQQLRSQASAPPVSAGAAAGSPFAFPAPPPPAPAPAGPPSFVGP